VSLRAKLVLALVACTTAASAAVGLLSYRSAAQGLHFEVDSSLSAAVDDAAQRAARAAGLAAPDGDGDRPGSRARDLAAILGGAPGGIDLQLLTAAGVTRVAPGRPSLPAGAADVAIARRAAPGVQLFRDLDIDGVHSRMLTRSVGGGQAAVQAARSLEEVDRVLRGLRLRVLVLSAGVAAVSALAGWLIARRVTDRLLRLTAAAERVAATGDLEVEVPVEGADETARLGGAFNDMLVALARSRDDQQRLVQDVGHELRTPMTSLRTNIFALRSFEALGPRERGRVLGDLESETDELTRLINEVVEVATDGRQDEEPVPLDLAALAARQAEQAASRSGRAVLTRVSPAPLVGREAALRRAVRNLVENALKFDTTGGPVEVWVGPSDVAGPSGAGVRVADRGPGFEAEDLPHVFDRFYRSVSARSAPGSGLGLAIVAEVVAGHGGSVVAENRPGGGAVVGFDLPPVPPVRPVPPPAGPATAPTTPV
jgi:two-component system sensor histidine kinase MprB